MLKTFWRRGDLFIWLAGVALAASLIMVAALLFSVFVNGTAFFWPREVVQFSLAGDKKLLGQITDRERIPQPGATGDVMYKHRIQVKLGNRDVYGIDFRWLDEEEILERSTPENAVVIERTEWGDFIGFVREVRDGDRVLARGSEAGMEVLGRELPKVEAVKDDMGEMEKEIGEVNYYLEQNRLKLKKLKLKGITAGKEVQALEQNIPQLQAKYLEQEKELSRLRQSLTTELVLSTVDGRNKIVPLSKVVRIYDPNSFGLVSGIGFFLEKGWEFIFADPRESNTEGGVFPAIFGTVMMVFIMSLFATPLGILAAIYLREFAKQGTFVSIVRIAVNNLAGVPSIVFGVFGVGFFIYLVGGSIDTLFYPESLPTPTYGTGGILWASLTMALLTVPVVIVATEEGLAAVPRGTREASLALGATRLETTLRVVIPAVLPSILTGLILAMARAAGEVAPLMITGVVKMAPSLPVDGFWPFIHLERKFMHLGFHIYDVGFQSPNVDAARPMVFTTTLLLIGIVILLNLTAIFLRNRLRKRLAVSGV